MDRLEKTSKEEESVRLRAGVRGHLPLEVPHKVAALCLWGPPMAVSAGPAGHSLCDLGPSLLMGEDKATYPEPGRGAMGMLARVLRALDAAAFQKGPNLNAS